MPLSLRTLLLAALLMLPALPATAQPATPVDLHRTMQDHVAWVVSLFDGAADDLTPADVEARFDDSLLRLVPPEEFIATVRQLADRFGSIALVEEQPSSPDEFVGLFRSESGDGLMLSIAIDPETGLIVGIFITPAPLPGASPTASPEASPAASPVAAGPVVEDPEAQIALYQDTLAAIRTVGEPVVEAVLAGDDEALAPMLSPMVASVLEMTPIGEVIETYTTRRLAMTYSGAGAHFFGRWTDDTISGVMIQNGAPYPFELTADEPQDGGLPAGVWRGALSTIGLELAVTFGIDDRGDLTATLDIPAQQIAGAALSDVRYRAEQPVGERIDKRVFAPGASDSYTTEFAWGDARLRVAVGVDIDSGKVTTLQVLPAVPAAPPTDAPEPTGTYRLPFDGTWWVFWGGETELQNYHVASPAQRYAYDLVIWKDGATWHGDGADNADYWAWSQPVLAPASGEVVRAVDGREDIAPNTAPAERGTAAPAGNHVVIEIAEGEYVVVAHLRQGSVRVRPGDRVEAGDLLGLVGNSGNTSEPHVHIHVQTTPDVLDPAAEGVPLRFASILVDGEPATGAVPVQGSFVANP